jgi:hypothetical protein
LMQSHTVQIINKNLCRISGPSMSPVSLMVLPGSKGKSLTQSPEVI